MPAHARAAVISMEARAKNGDDSYRLTDPEVRRHFLDTCQHFLILALPTVQLTPHCQSLFHLKRPNYAKDETYLVSCKFVVRENDLDVIFPLMITFTYLHSCVRLIKSVKWFFSAHYSVL